MMRWPAESSSQQSAFDFWEFDLSTADFPINLERDPEAPNDETKARPKARVIEALAGAGTLKIKNFFGTARDLTVNEGGAYAIQATTIETGSTGVTRIRVWW